MAASTERKWKNGRPEHRSSFYFEDCNSTRVRNEDDKEDEKQDKKEDEQQEVQKENLDRVQVEKGRPEHRSSFVGENHNSTRVSNNKNEGEEDIRMTMHDSDSERLSAPTPEEEAAIMEWCHSEHVSLHLKSFDISDGTIKPLTEAEEKELKEHISSGHLTKSNLCRGCLLSEGPRRIHKRIRDVDRATHVLHIDIAGPLVQSNDGFYYFLVGALRLPDLPLLIDVRLLRTRTSVEVCAALERMTSYFESLSFEGFPITDSPRIRRLHSDRAGEFTAPYLQKFLHNHRSIYHTLTTGYDPQSNGTAERAVGLLKTLGARCLASAQVSEQFWSYAVRYATQSLICSALQRKQKSPPFGAQVIAQVLGHKGVKFPKPKTLSGRLLFWDHLQDLVSYVLSPSEDDSEEWIVYRAGMPALTPPTGSEEPVVEITSTKDEKAAFDKALKREHLEDIDLDDEFLLTMLEDSPFTYLQLCSEELHSAFSADDVGLQEQDQDTKELIQDYSPQDKKETTDKEEEERRRQATTHIAVSPDKVLASTGQEREKWLAAGRKEIDNLTLPKAISTISPQERQELRDLAKLKGEDYVELPAKVVFTIKPEKYKVRIVACGNQTDDTYGKVTTTDMDAAMLRYLLSWSAASRDNVIASLDVTAAFLNADLPPGRIVVLRPPTILYKLGLLPTGSVWRVHRAIYGLREAPALWSNERTAVMSKMKFRAKGESYCVKVSEIHRSICLIVREADLLSQPVTLHTGLTHKVLPEKVAALCGIYVDDYISTGPKEIVSCFLSHLRITWKTSDPLFLIPGVDFSFLGITLEISSFGILLHQRVYTEAILDEYKDVIPQRKRVTTGEPEHFDKSPPIVPDLNNPEHAAWIKRGQKVLGALLWLSTRTRPDIACAVSMAAQALWHDLEKLKMRIKHLLQYLLSTGTLGLRYLFPQNDKRSSPLTEFTVFSDASFAPAGRQSQTGYAVFLTYGSVKHLVHWHSTREKKVAESSAEAELYALSAAFKAGRNFRLLVQENLSTEIILNLRCDNKAAIAMMDEPSWRTRYISIYGEALRQELLERTAVLTFVSTEVQLADPLTKPVTAKIGETLLPLWGMTAHEMMSVSLRDPRTTLLNPRRGNNTTK